MNTEQNYCGLKACKEIQNIRGHVKCYTNVLTVAQDRAFNPAMPIYHIFTNSWGKSLYNSAKVQ
jgi:hypothetical protein